VLPDDFLASLSETNYTERWKRVISEGTSKVVVAEDGADVVGFASGGRERAGEPGYEGELYAIYVLDTAQRRGFGRELVRASVDRLRELGLRDMIIWVLRDNRPARDFYERLGGIYVRSQPITIGSVTPSESMSSTTRSGSGLSVTCPATRSSVPAAMSCATTRSTTP